MPLTASQIIAKYAPRGYSALEAAVPAMARAGDGLVLWPLAPVTFTDGRRRLVVHVASDYLAVGTSEDYLYVPLTPESAQEVADGLGMMLPTCAMVKAIYEQAAAKLPPIRSGELSPPQANLGANLGQIAAHSGAIRAQLARLGDPAGLRSGHKKDVVIGNLWKPSKVLIYGWLKGDVPPGPDPSPMWGDPLHDRPPWRIQMYSNVHASFYYDYSHGIRLVSQRATLDDREVDLASVLGGADAPLVSWEGALKQVRYPTPGRPVAVPRSYVPTNPGLAQEGLAKVLGDALKSGR